MGGSTFGSIFRVTTWGESHGAALGAVVDGVPAGLPLCEADVQRYLDRRRPGQNIYTTSRKEADRVRILSGVFEGRTTGTPVSMIVENTDQRSRDYSQIKEVYRPGHADHTFDLKYGFRDYRGGGRSSGRETIGRVCGGAVAGALLSLLGIRVCAYTASIGPAVCDPKAFDADHIPVSPLFMPDAEAEKKAMAYLEECIRSRDSAGGTVECRVTGMLPGLGEPVFDKLDARLGAALFSIGAVKAVEIGDGITAGLARGSEFNDMYLPSGTENDAAAPGSGSSDPVKATNHAGGILGGISDGSDLFMRVTFKPTPSIARTQQALTPAGTVEEISIHGRHDPVIVPRAVVVVESMVAMTLADLYLQNLGSRIN